MIVFVGVAPEGELPPRAHEALARAREVVTDPAVASIVAAATTVEVHTRTGIDDLLARARSEIVVRAMVATPTFDAAALAEIAAASEAPIAIEIVPPEEVEKLPLAGKRVLVTRASEQAEGMARALRRRGAIPLVAPTIAIGAPDDPEPLRRAVKDLERYDVVAFTSANGVDAFFAALDEATLDARAFGRAKVASIGPGTSASLSRHGVRADLMAEEHRGEALADAILAALNGRGGARVLLPRAAVARNALPDTLTAHGMHVDVVAAYRSRTPDAATIASMRARLASTPLDAATFTASSTVERFSEIFPDARELLSRTMVASIGPITSDTCRRLGLDVAVEANPYTIPALIAALESAFTSR